MACKFVGVLEDYAVMTVACAIFTVAWECFMIPNGMSSGGMMGLCTLLQYATDGVIQASVSYFAINASLILLAVLLFGLGFGFRTLYCIFMSSVMLKLFSALPSLQAVPGNFFYVDQKVFIPLIAGVLEAVGIGLCIRKGGSTGGTDIVALIVNRYWPVPLSKVFLLTDFLVICSMLLLPGKTFSDTMYGFEMMVAFSAVIDTVIGGQKSSYQLMIFSDRYEGIADYIINVMERGATVLKARGWYTKKDRDVLMVMLSQNELPALTKKIKEMDSRAFLTVSKIGSVYGEGFEEIKAGFSKRNKQNEN